MTKAVKNLLLPSLGKDVRKETSQTLAVRAETETILFGRHFGKFCQN